MSPRVLHGSRTRLFMSEGNDFDLSKVQGAGSKNKKASAPAAASTPAVSTSAAASTSSVAAPKTKKKKSKKKKKKDDPNKFKTTEGYSPTFANQTSMHIPGIGGQNGHSYNVNKLKTNLVQQAVCNYKKQLWDLLGTPDASQCLIEEKLAALCQSNPVYTTTDSNLLEGPWEFVFDSKKPASVLLDEARFGPGYKSKVGSDDSSDDIVGTTEHGVRRFILEDLEQSQDPFVVDCKRYWLGLSRVKYYRVKSLTRTTLDLNIFRTTWKFCNWPLLRKRYRTMQATSQVKILYVDTDLCITASSSLEEPFTVYTKSPEWVARTQQLKRRWKKMRSQVTHIKDRFHKKDDSMAPIAPTEPSMWVEYSTDDARLRVVKLGGVDGEEDVAWEGESDPFVHLNADERQRILKKLHVGEIEEMAKEQIKDNSKSRKKSIVLERKKSFKKAKFDPIDADFLQE